MVTLPFLPPFPRCYHRRMASTQRRGRPKVPSIADVALLAGVSAQTVSRVSTGSPSVRPATRERVVNAMTELGYTPNRAARALRVGTFGSIGVITQRLARTGEAMTTAVITDIAREIGYSVTLVEVPRPVPDELRSVSHRLSNSAIDGLIIVRAGLATPDELSLPPGMPVVASDSLLAGHYPSAVPNQVRGTQDAVTHLLGLGHRTVHHIAGAADSYPSEVRRSTWQRCLATAGREVPEPWMGDWSPMSGYLIGREIARREDVTAVYCANDEMAFGLIRALHEAGRRVPEDVSVVGFDGIQLSEFSYPPLTTVRQDFDRLGHELMRLLLEQLSGTAQQSPPRVVVPTQLLVRGTTAPPPR